MKFLEKKLDDGFEYFVEDIFGEMTITSKGLQLKVETLDLIVSSVLQSGKTSGDITPKVSFSFKKRIQWEEEEDTKQLEEALKPDEPKVSPKSRAFALILVTIFGLLGLHRFYIGRRGTGLMMLACSLSVFGLSVSIVVTIIDFFLIAFGQMHDGDNLRLVKW